ncbi:MAG: hypothetical protein Q9201_003226 [Fulgogasparrea decipioides]
MTPTNTLLIRHCTSMDIPNLAALHLASFQGPRNDVISHNMTPENKLKYLEDNLRHKVSLYSTLSSHPQFVNFLCVVDTATNTIIAYAAWIYLPTGYDASKDPDTQHPPLPSGINEALLCDFGRMTGELRSADPGRKDPHWLLSLLATHPEHQGRGAGSMLIEWAFPKADEMGVMCYVDSSAAGYSLYKKKGFKEAVGVLDLDLGHYEGGQAGNVPRWVALVRSPKVMKVEAALESIN